MSVPAYTENLAPTTKTILLDNPYLPSDLFSDLDPQMIEEDDRLLESIQASRLNPPLWDFS